MPKFDLTFDNLSRRFLTSLTQSLDHVAPSLCLWCHAASEHRHGLCIICQRAIDVNPSPCLICALPGRGPGQCRKCCKESPPYQRIVSPFLYKEPLSSMIRALKFKRRLELVRPLAGLWLDAVAHRVELPTCLIPVPMDKQSARKRGFNPAAQIARAFGRDLNITVIPSGISKVRRTQPQSMLNANMRRGNVHGVFEASKALPYARVAIVDDVVTTTRTARAVAGCLQTSGVLSVAIWAIARTP